ncbi:MAG: alpha/beta hydrolase [Limnobacter sp.]|nr:alpha/beta hydrolase [Limnobacter sp.]
MPKPTGSLIDWKADRTQSTTGLHMAWESAGREDAPTIVLIAGLACQLTLWHDDFCLPLLQLGYRLIRFDNRDVGLTDEHPAYQPASIPFTFLKNRFGVGTRSMYTLETLADDALGLITALGLEKPHLVGISMGGMIAQIMAAKAAQKIGKLVLLMTGTNQRDLPPPAVKVMWSMFMRKPRSDSEQDVVLHTERVMRIIGSRAYPTDRETLRKRIQAAYRRAFHPLGIIRQTHCVVASGSIAHFTRVIAVPTLIVHGTKDRLLKPACAIRLEKLIAGSKLHFIPGLAHDLPEQLSQTFAGLIHAHLQTSD